MCDIICVKYVSLVMAHKTKGKMFRESVREVR